MPLLSRWSIRLALGYLLLGFTLGAWLLIGKGTGCCAAAWHALPAHQEFLLIGWTAQLALGIAYWILPRFRGNRRGRVWLAVAAIVSLNLGVWLVALSPWLKDAARPVGRTFEALAVVAYVVYAWPRIKPAGA